MDDAVAEVSMTSVGGTEIGTRLDRVPLYRHALTAAGRSWRIDAVKDQDALLAAADHFDAFPYGLLLWEAGVALAEELPNLGSLAGRRVLELGAGVGFAGLVSRYLGAEVMQTDHAPEALEMCRRNAELNGIEGIVVALADWADWHIPGRFDIILGADILYDGSAHTLVARVLEASLATDGVALLTSPRRAATPHFVRDMRAAGWQVKESIRRIDALHPVRPGEAVDVTLMKIWR